jgi:hypothetical protein
MRRLPATLIVLLATGVLLAPPAAAQSPAGGEPIVVLTGWLDVPEGVSVDDAVIFDGDATIDGTVEGNAVAFNGDVTIRGRVVGDVVAFTGHVTLASGASVGGDIVSRTDPTIAQDATLGGRIVRNELRAQSLVLVGRLAFWVVASVSSLLLGLLIVLVFPRGADATVDAARRRVGASIGFGALVFVGIPIVGAIALATIVGALFGIAVLTGMVLLYSVAYAAGALAAGRLLLKPPRKAVLAFLLGWTILRVLALVPVIGGVLFVAAAVWGFGALAVAGTRAGRATVGPVPDGAALAPPLPPMP